MVWPEEGRRGRKGFNRVSWFTRTFMIQFIVNGFTRLTRKDLIAPSNLLRHKDMIDGPGCGGV